MKANTPKDALYHTVQIVLVEANHTLPKYCVFSPFKLGNVVLSGLAWDEANMLKIKMKTVFIVQVYLGQWMQM